MSKLNHQQEQVPDYNTDIEYMEQQLIFTNNMFNLWVEKSRNITSIIHDLEEDLKRVKTPELIPVIQNMIVQNKQRKEQILEYIKRSKKDLRFINSIYKKLKSGT